MNTVEGTQEYHRHAIGKAILNLAPEDKGVPDIRGALDWLRSIKFEGVASTHPEPELTAELKRILDEELRIAAPNVRIDLTKPKDHPERRGPAGIPFGPHLTCSQCEDHCADHYIVSGLVWCPACSEGRIRPILHDEAREGPSEPSNQQSGMNEPEQASEGVEQASRAKEGPSAPVS